MDDINSQVTSTEVTQSETDKNALTYTSVKDPVWGDANHTFIICQVKFDNFADYIPFGAGATDPAAHGRQIWKELNEGTYGPIADFDESSITPEDQYAKAINSGMAVTFSTKALSGTYPLSSAEVAALSLEMRYVLDNTAFPVGKTHIVKDIDGNVKTFKNISDFTNLVNALVTRSIVLRQARFGNGSFPTDNSVTIG